MERVEVLVRGAASGQELKREWTKPELLKSINWLKRMNARGCDVFVRPAGQHGLVLVDGLNAESLSAMRQKGFEPAVVLESNPGVYQAWVVLSARPVADQTRQLAGEGLVRGFGGRLLDAPASGFGRLAGFTFDDARGYHVLKRRFVVAHEGRSTIARNGEKFLLQIERTLLELEPQRARKRTNEQQKEENLGRSR